MGRRGEGGRLPPTTTFPHKHGSPADYPAGHFGGKKIRMLRPANALAPADNLAPGGGYSGSWLPAPREEGELWEAEEGEEGEEGGRCAHVCAEKEQMSRRGDGWAEVNQRAHTYTRTHTRARAHRHASRRTARRQAARRAHGATVRLGSRERAGEGVERRRDKRGSRDA